MTAYLAAHADCLYISTEGHHISGLLDAPSGSFGPGDTDWKMEPGPSLVIISGCSVLDVTGDKMTGITAPSYGPFQVNLAPGRKWAKAGPCLLLGYEGKAP